MSVYPSGRFEAELRSIEQRLVELSKEKSDLLDRKAVLQQRLALGANQAGTPLTTKEKMSLFRELFQGRSDIFALRWENKAGRSGYTVACHNEWQAGLCRKPKIKCGECPHRSFKALDAKAIYDHLVGKQTVGLYSLLQDSSCHLLAADFDKADWQSAAKAYAQACVSLQIPYAIERSRSGNGAHVWIFFSEPVPAKEARRLGFLLLDRAMEIHPGLSFESYDRLFPNQDRIPEGGFGNLIALPLQHSPRQSGNSVFVDMDLVPYQDQWGFLQQIGLVMPNALTELLKVAQDRAGEATFALKPWEEGLPVKPKKLENCPASLTVVLANQLYVPIDKLPPTLIARLKRLASFSNPVFFKTQALRFSTQGIPRFISCARIEQDYLSIPRGCLDGASALLKEQGVELQIDDKRNPGIPLKKFRFQGELRKEQRKAVAAMTRHDVGVLHAPTAFGKTVTAIGIIAKRKTNTLILTHSRQLLDQWRERLGAFAEGAKIGVIGGGRKKPSGEIDVATYQSLIDRKDNTVREWVHDYGQIIVDECHHVSAPRFEMVLNAIHAKYVLGLTATPERQDGHQPIIFMAAGPVRHKVRDDRQVQFEQQLIVRWRDHLPPHELVMDNGRPHIADVYRWLSEDEVRNQTIIDDVSKAVEAGRNPLVLTERREHAKRLSERIAGLGYRVATLRGAMSAKERSAVLDSLDEVQVLIATGKYIGEGFDLPRLDTLFLALPISWKGSLAQYVGRIHRNAEGKERVLVYDYVDSGLPTLKRMFQRREKGYKALGYVEVSG